MRVNLGKIASDGSLIERLIFSNVIIELGEQVLKKAQAASGY